MKTRIKLALPAIATREEAEAVMTALAEAENARRAINATRDAEILAINSKHENNLAVCEAAIKEQADTLRVWAESHPEEFPKGRKSLDMTSGSLGFRTGTPKLALLNRSWSWEKVLASLRAMRLTDFIRTKEEVDKEAVLAYAAAVSTNAESISRNGMRVVQDETFFVEPKLSDMDARQTQAA